MNVRFTASEILSSNIVEFPLLSVIKLKHSIALRFWLGCWAICPQLLSLLASEWVRAVGHMLETWRKEEFRMNPWSFPASDSVTVPKVSLCPKLVSLVSVSLPPPGEDYCDSRCHSQLWPLGVSDTIPSL